MPIMLSLLVQNWFSYRHSLERLKRCLRIFVGSELLNMVSQLRVNKDSCKVSQVLKGMISLEYYSLIGGSFAAVIYKWYLKKKQFLNQKTIAKKWSCLDIYRSNLIKFRWRSYWIYRRLAAVGYSGFRGEEYYLRYKSEMASWIKKP